jgi:hypothetical protein
MENSVSAYNLVYLQRINFSFFYKPSPLCGKAKGINTFAASDDSCSTSEHTL